MSFRLFNQNKKGPARIAKRGGFTLLEMMVVIAIITVMTGVLLGNLPNFRDSTTLQLVSQEVAVTIRQAQVFGIGTKVSSGQFYGHGMYFCNPYPPNQSGAVNEGCKKHFLLFSDLESSPGSGPNKFFDTGNGFHGLTTSAQWVAECKYNSSECQEVYTLGGNIEVCDIAFEDGDTGRASITFSRLYPDAFIRNDPGDTNANKNRAYIYLRSTRTPDRGRVIEVYNTGAISIKSMQYNSTSVCPTS